MVSTHLKNISQNGNLPQIGVKIKHIWNHHPVIYGMILQAPIPTHPHLCCNAVQTSPERTLDDARARMATPALNPGVVCRWPKGGGNLPREGFYWGNKHFFKSCWRCFLFGKWAFVFFWLDFIFLSLLEMLIFCLESQWDFCSFSLVDSWWEKVWASFFWLFNFFWFCFLVMMG